MKSTGMYELKKREEETKRNSKFKKKLVISDIAT